MKKIAIIASNLPQVQEKLAAILKKYNFIQLDSLKQKPEVDLIIILGGDGFMLHCLHSLMHFDIPIYGINCGTVGFLLNPFDIDNLDQRLENAVPTIIHPLEMQAKLADGTIKTKLAVNEVSLYRKTSQSARFKIIIDGEVRMPELVGDGILLATPAGSTAYNYSIHGPILPIGSNILALTPISPFRPRKWSGAILPNSVEVEITILDGKNRPANAVADFLEVTDVEKVKIKERRDISMRLLFNPDHSLEDRIIKEQFA